MRRLVVALAAVLIAFPAAPAFAQTGTPAQVVNACGTPNNTPVVGNYYSITQDKTLTLCTAGGGGGGGGAVTIADGADVTLGAKADAATCATTNTAMACFRQLHSDMTSAIPAGANLIGKVGIDQTTPGTTNGVQITNSSVAVTAAASAIASSAAVDGWDLTKGAKADSACGTDNGTCSQVALVKRSNQDLTTLNTSVNAATPAGTNLIGKVGIDQTTPGTTNAVVSTSAGPYPLTSTPIVAASATTGATANAATLAGAASVFTYLTSMQCTALGSTAASSGNITLTGTGTTLNFAIGFPLGATVAATPVIITFNPPLKSSAVSTSFVATLPAAGTGNTYEACNLEGYRQ